MKRILSTTTLALILFAALFQTGAVATTNATIPRQASSVENALDILKSAPDFEQHLDNYDAVARELEDYLETISMAEDVVRLIDRLKSTKVPLVGNAWKALVQAANMASPGAGDALEALDQSLRYLIDLRGKIHGFENLNPVSAASRMFRDEPNGSTLTALQEAINQALPAMKSVRDDLANLDSKVANVISALDRILEYQDVQEVLGELNEPLNELQAPLKDLYAFESSLTSQLAGDIRIMENILDAGNGDGDDVPPGPDPDEPTDGSPEDSLIAYWEMVSAGNFPGAWVALTPGFQQRQHKGQYSDYLRGYQRMRLCSVKAENVRLLSMSNGTATVAAHIIYRAGSSCRVSEYDFNFELVYDAELDTWLLDQISKSKTANIVVRIDYPTNGQVLPSTVDIIGTATCKGFNYYKLNLWSISNSICKPCVLSTPGNHSQVVNSRLARWDTTGVVAGDYDIELVAVCYGTAQNPKPKVRISISH
ncbi:MAG: LXG domain-containing protein [Chloroflexi bacterium]|nr:LXG domain-containing protein [Chloroflexota bacterium]